MPIGRRLRERRLEKGLTLEDLEEATEVSNPYLSRIERDLVVPRRDTFKRIADQLEAGDELLVEWDCAELERLGYDPLVAGLAAALERLEPDTRAAVIQGITAELSEITPTDVSSSGDGVVSSPSDRA